MLHIGLLNDRSVVQELLTTGQSVASNQTAEVQPLSPDSAVAATNDKVTSGTASKPSSATATDHVDEDESDENEYEDEDEEPQVIVETSTRPPLSSVVTPPMPVIPLQTVFTVTGGESEAACIAVKAGIRFTFNYANVSSGKACK